MKPVLKTMLVFVLGVNMAMFYFNWRYLRYPIASAAVPPGPAEPAKQPSVLERTLTTGSTTKSGTEDSTNRNRAAAIPVTTVRFDSSDSTLLPESQSDLNLLAQTLSEQPSLRATIMGHTDNSGQPLKNIKLSVARAEVVRDYLVDLGVSKERLSVVGYGSAMSIATNETKEGRERNRRVEIRVQP